VGSGYLPEGKGGREIEEEEEEEEEEGVPGGAPVVEGESVELS